MNEVTLFRWGGEGKAGEVRLSGISTYMANSLYFMHMLFENDRVNRSFHQENKL